MKAFKIKKVFVFSLFVTVVLFAFSKDLFSLEIMGTDRIKQGMKGYGKTVFSGTNIEEFGVEIIGVLKNVRPQGDIILAKLSGGPLEKTGVIAGMSGSPVYIENKLIGAIAFSWAYSKEPFAGITPISDMLRIYKATTNEKGKELKKTRLFYELDGGSRNLELFTEFNGNSMILKAIQTPVVFSSVDERLVSLFRAKFNEFGMMAVQGGSGSATGMKKNSLNPGDAVGVQLVSGDLNITGIGTVTYREGNNILIFGHPMFFRGKTSMPMTTAYVHSVLPSISLSFKFASSLNVVGTVKQDMLTGVYGILEEEPKMIPLSVKYKDMDSTITYRYSVINDIIFTSRFLMLCSINSVLMNRAILDKSTIEMEIDITLNDGNRIKLGDTFSDITSVYSLYNGLEYLMMPVNEVMVNRFKEVGIEKIDVHVDLEDRIRYAQIEDIKLGRRKVKPGSKVDVFVTCKPFLGETFSKKFIIEIPDYLRDSKVSIFAGSALTEQVMDYFQNPLKFEPKSYDKLIEILNKLQRNDHLMVWMQTSEKGLVIEGEEYPNLPGSLYSIMRDSNKSGNTFMPIKYKKSLPTDYVIGGIKIIDLEVTRRAE